jgi:hypothetical protein
MKLYKVPETLASKIPIGKIIKYIKKDDKSLTPHTGIVIKHNENSIVLKRLGGSNMWCVGCKKIVCYVTKDILDSIKRKKKN